ncbi:YqiA/YcfP family alpha/beta fold hydrolase [Shewanella sp. SR44-3]|uniref:YqiA/YcfP family alpha/beta fold hydrolase n=1 Tax=unclassified Shewanella TaxID=196818 RepID=UPI0015FA1F95|nr:YqiA/YcfP family alpha/beta fold hydrolase [Shewanella sp. SR44-3]MBB1268309.1 esterase YqiA [Shewanella sp. SR44-3]
MLLYIHGFNSSPQSDKARVTAEYISTHYPQLTLHQPQLPSSPTAAMALLESLCLSAIAKGEPLAFIGSSLGGYFSSYLAERFGGRAVLVNPAIKPFELFEQFVGPQYNPYTDEHYYLSMDDKDDVAKYDTAVICHPERFLVLLQTGDEVLDYRQALHKYHHCELYCQPGGDHSFVGYQQHLKKICQFLQLD